MSLSPAELDSLVERIAKAVAVEMATQPRLQDYPGIAKILKVSQVTCERLVRAGAIPVVRIGSRVMFDVDEVVAALSRREVVDTAVSIRISEPPSAKKQEVG